MQDPSTVGTMFNTLSARIRGASADLESLGEQQDEYTKSTSKLRKTVLALSGVDIMQNDNTFKDIYDIIDEIGQRWDSISDVDQSALAEALAGKRNARGLYSIFSNMQDLEGAYETSKNSEGSAQEEEERYEQSLQYRLDKIKASWQELSNSVLSSNGLKAILDIVNAIAQGLSKISDMIGPGGSLATLIGGGALLKNVITNKGLLADFLNQKNLDLGGSTEQTFGKTIRSIIDKKGGIKNILKGAFSSLKSRFSKDAKEGMEDLGENVVDFTGYKKAMQEGADATGALAKSEEVASTAGSTLLGSLGKIALAVGALVAVYKIAEAIFNATTTSYKEANNERDKSLSSAKQQSEAVKNTSKELAQKKNRLVELEGMGNRTPQEEAELKVLKKQTRELQRQKDLNKKKAKADYTKAAENASESFRKNQKRDTFEENNAYYQARALASSDITGRTSELIENQFNGADSSDATKMAGELKKLQSAQKKMKKAEDQMAKDRQRGIDKLKKQGKSITEANIAPYTSVSSKDYQKAKKAFDDQTEDMDDYVSTLKKDVDAWQSYLDNVGFNDEYFNNLREAKKLLKEYDQMDMSGAEKKWDNIKSTFQDNEDTKQLSSYLLDVAKSGGSASDALSKLGVNLEDIGLKSKDLADIDKYFNSLADSANQATEQTDKYDGSLKSLQDAMDSKNAGADFDTVSGYLSDLQKEYTSGKVGTDEFQSAVEFFSPNRVSSQKNLQAYKKQGKREADAYTDEFKNIQDKIKRYFTPDDTSTEDVDEGEKSYQNLLDDLTKAGLAVKSIEKDTGRTRYTLADNFRSSSEAAKALGLSVEATDVALKHMQDYGFDFGDDFVWAGEMAQKYEATLKGLNKQYEQTKETYGADSTIAKIQKQRIDSYQQEYDKMKDDLSEEQVVKIKFEYDMEELRQQAQQAGLKAQSSGYSDSTLNAEAIASQQEMINKWKAQFQQQQIDIPVNLTNIDQQIQDLQSKVSQTTDADERKVMQQQILNYQAMYDAIAQMSSDPSVTTVVFKADVDGVLQSVEAIKNEDGTISYRIDTNGNGKFGEELLSSEEFQKKVNINVDDSSVKTFKEDASEAQKAIDDLGNGQTIVFSADTTGLNSAVSVYRDQNGTIHYSADGAQAQQDISSFKQWVNAQKPVILFDVNLTSAFNKVKNFLSWAGSQLSGFLSQRQKVAQNSPDMKAGMGVGKAIYNATHKSSKKKSGKKSGKHELNGTVRDFNAYASGTIKKKKQKSEDVTNVEEDKTVNHNEATPQFSKNDKNKDRQNQDNSQKKKKSSKGSAHASGTIEDEDIDDIITDPSNQTTTASDSLVGQVGQEIVVDPKTNKWHTVGDNGAEFTHIPKGAVVFNADQTDELLRGGKITSRGSAFLSGTAYKKGSKKSSKKKSSSKGSYMHEYYNGEQFRYRKNDYEYYGYMNVRGKASIGWHKVSKKQYDALVRSAKLKSGQKKSYGRAYNHAPANVQHNHGVKRTNHKTVDVNGRQGYSNVTPRYGYGSGGGYGGGSGSSGGYDGGGGGYDGGSGSGDGSGGGDSSEPQVETFDWVERAIKRVEREISNLDAVVGATYKDWGSRNTALSGELGKVTEEINTQQQGYQTYMNKANSIGLNQDYVNKIQNGQMNIEDITDETTKKQIQDYQSW